MNVITKSGGNTFKRQRRVRVPAVSTGTATTSTTAPTAPGCRPGTGGTPTTAYVRPVRRRAGGPMMTRQGLVLRRAAPGAVVEPASAAPSAEVERIKAYKPDAELFNNDSESWQPFFKVTQQGRRSHDVQALLPAAIGCCSRATASTTTSRSRRSRPAGRSTAARSRRCGASSTTTTFSGVVQRQGRQRHLDVRDARPHRARRSSSTTRPRRRGDTLPGTGRILEGGNLQSYTYQPASQIVAARRPDLLQGRLDRATTSSRPGSSPRRAAPTTRTPTT